MSTSSSSTPDDSSFSQEARTQTLKAIVLIVVAVGVAVLLLHHTPGSGSTVSTKTTIVPPTTTSAATTPTTEPNTIPPAQVKVLVLNGTLKGTLAGQLTTKLKSGPGYATVTPDNTTSAVTTSTVYAVTSQYTNEAQAIATSLGLPATDVVTNLPATVPIAHSEQTEANVIVVIGPDLATRIPTLTVGTPTAGTSTATTTAG